MTEYFGKHCVHFCGKWEETEEVNPNFKEAEPVICFCNHKGNENGYEGNCNEKDCPLKKNAMKTYYIFWLDGEKEEAKGINEGDAFRRAGYGAGAVQAVDVISTEDKYEWDSILHKWATKKI